MEVLLSVVAGFPACLPRAGRQAGKPATTRILTTNCVTPNLIDSDWIIDALIGTPTAVNTLVQLNSDGLAVSIIAVGEVYEGAHGFPDPQGELAKYRHYLAGFTILGLSEPVMVTFSQVRASLRRQGSLIPDLDLLIAATALTHDLTLLTRNTRHFQRVPGLKRW